MSSNRRAFWASLVSPPFVLCVAVLVAAAIVSGPVAGRLAVALIKKPIQCRKPLHEMRKDALGPYEFRRDEQMNATMLATLGTKHYLSRILVDTREAPRSPLRLVTVFITYHTGTANLVPHTPDVCYRGGGYKPRQPHEDVPLDVPTLARGNTVVPVRVCTFRKSQVFGSREPTVVYTFHSNGRFASSSYTVRRLINDPRTKHAYFSKVEVSFSSETAGARNPTREQSVEAAKELLAYLLPVLVEEHYPNWEAVRGDEQTG